MSEFREAYFSVDSCKPDAAFLLSENLSELISNFNCSFSKIIILCIGTDRSTGDSLGPLVGHKLTSSYVMNNCTVYGNLKNPVHAKNLDDTLSKIHASVHNPFIIAVDASLGRLQNVGKINIYQGPLYPGAGVNKVLNSVGNISITGIVNTCGYMEYVVLQNTRLSLVMDIADTISLSIYMALRNQNFSVETIS